MPRKGIVTTDPLYWLPVNIDEWLVKIAGGLTTLQFGAAAKLLLPSWRHQPPCTLPDDDDFLSEITGLGSKWRRNRARILEVTQFYQAQRGRLVCPWLLALHREQTTKFEHRSAANKENRAKRQQGELELPSSPTIGRTNRGTKQGTNGTTNRVQNEKGEGVAPTGLTPEPQQHSPPDAPAPEGARAGSVGDERPIEDRTVPRGDRRPFRLTDIVPVELRPKREAAP